MVRYLLKLGGLILRFKERDGDVPDGKGARHGTLEGNTVTSNRRESRMGSAGRRNATSGAAPRQSSERTTGSVGGRRRYMSQSDVPSFTLKEALRVPRAIADNYGKSPTAPLRVAEAMGIQPSSWNFRGVTGAAIAYGIIDGGSKSSMIEITPLGRRIVAPTAEGDDIAAMRDAVMRPRVVREFLTKYDGSRLPAENIGRNVLEELGVPPDATDRVLSIILNNAHELGLVRTINSQEYLHLDGTATPSSSAGETAAPPAHNLSESRDFFDQDEQDEKQPSEATPKSQPEAVFITHGKNHVIVDQLKSILVFGKFRPVVSEERQTTAKPIPQKVMDDMRGCSAAIIHVCKEMEVIDSEGNPHNVLNSNVLIEIGAAMALYPGRFILLVEKGANLPSNLQGLYEVRYEGERLEYDATMKLLQAFNSFRP